MNKSIKDELNVIQTIIEAAERNDRVISKEEAVVVNGALKRIREVVTQKMSKKDRDFKSAVKKYWPGMAIAIMRVIKIFTDDP